MLQNLSQYLTQTSSGADGAEDVDAAKYRLAESVHARAVADAELRDAEAAIWQIADPKPDLQTGEIWATRPKPWSQSALARHFVGSATGTEIAPSLTLYHDCPLAQLTLRQLIAAPSSPAPFILKVDVLHFEGSFLSLCLNLDDPETSDWHKDDVIRVSLQAEMETGLPIYARLNLKQGPNVLQQLAGFGFGDASHGRHTVGFDLAYAGLSQNPVEAAWVDLILEKPSMNAVTLHDVTLSRSKRADL
ncbi:MAG: DUF6478 family protein [Dinoroseobacter sp.]|nr:DUF6478 family protein [Dinoroseobacter sp.]